MSNNRYSGAYSRRRYSNFSAASSGTKSSLGASVDNPANPNPDVCTLRVQFDASQGRVTAAGMQDGSVTVRKGTQVTIEATPKDGYRFKLWDMSFRTPAGTDPTANPITLTVNGNNTVKAVFESVKPLEEPPTTPSPTPTPSTPTPSTPAAGIADKAVAFAKKWWWALLIVGYIVYKEREGGRK